MKRFFRYVTKGIIISVLIVTVLLCTACDSGTGRYNQNKPIQSINTAMGTIINQTIYVDEKNRKDTQNDFERDKITGDIIKIITDLERDYLSWRLESSELYAVNQSAGMKDGISLSEELEEILKRCLAVSEASGGAFDITIGEVVRLWDIDSWAATENSSSYVMPATEDIQTYLSNTGYKKLNLQKNILFLPSDMQLDLGAVGKGIALDSLYEYLLNQEEITGAVISVGGSILTYGQKEDGSPWRVAVVNPTDTSKSIGYLELKGQWCVSTSGDYERYVEIDGVRYHHIIDPATGYPTESGLSSVTILTKDGLLSDALSTACFILGQEEGQKLAEAYDAEAVFVDCEGNITMTKGMEQYLRLN